jgi:hypothetical protein
MEHVALCFHRQPHKNPTWSGGQLRQQISLLRAQEAILQEEVRQLRAAAQVYGAIIKKLAGRVEESGL